MEENAVYREACIVGDEFNILMKAEMPGISDVCLKNATCSSC